MSRSLGIFTRPLTPSSSNSAADSTTSMVARPANSDNFLYIGSPDPTGIPLPKPSQHTDFISSPISIHSGIPDFRRESPPETPEQTRMVPTTSIQGNRQEAECYDKKVRFPKRISLLEQIKRISLAGSKGLSDPAPSIAGESSALHAKVIQEEETRSASPQFSISLPPNSRPVTPVPTAQSRQYYQYPTKPPVPLRRTETSFSSLSSFSSPPTSVVPSESSNGRTSGVHVTRLHSREHWEAMGHESVFQREDVIINSGIPVEACSYQAVDGSLTEKPIVAKQPIVRKETRMWSRIRVLSSLFVFVATLALLMVSLSPRVIRNNLALAEIRSVVNNGTSLQSSLILLGPFGGCAYENNLSDLPFACSAASVTPNFSGLYKALQIDDVKANGSVVGFTVLPGFLIASMSLSTITFFLLAYINSFTSSVSKKLVIPTFVVQLMALLMGLIPSTIQYLQILNRKRALLGSDMSLDFGNSFILLFVSFGLLAVAVAMIGYDIILHRKRSTSGEELV